jgi:hypothetical protein
MAAVSETIWSPVETNTFGNRKRMMHVLVLTTHYPPDGGPAAPMSGMLCEELVRIEYAYLVRTLKEKQADNADYRSLDTRLSSWPTGWRLVA